MIRIERCNESAILVLLVLSCGLLATSAIGGEQPETASVVTTLQRGIPEAFTLEVELNLPVHFFLPGQGNITKVTRITVGKDVMAIVWKASKLPPAKYYPPNTGGYQGGDFDANGKLMVAMWSEGATIRDQRVHEEYLEGGGFSVGPDQEPVPTGGVAVHLSRFPPSHENTVIMNTLRGIRCALGRLSGDDLGELESDVAKPDGTRELRVTGQFSPFSGIGVWDLVIDPANGDLVRHAGFGARGEEPRITCSSEGTRWFGNIALAERGEYFSLLHTTVRLISFKPEMDPDVVAEARKGIARAQTRLVRVFDWRDDPTHPKVKTVQAGDLDKPEPVKP
ncbi:MAG: hypothetical protein AABZ47_08315 [Planctomycetota bacterium]